MAIARRSGPSWTYAPEPRLDAGEAPWEPAATASSLEQELPPGAIVMRDSRAPARKRLSRNRNAQANSVRESFCAGGLRRSVLWDAAV